MVITRLSHCDQTIKGRLSKVQALRGGDLNTGTNFSARSSRKLLRVSVKQQVTQEDINKLLLVPSLCCTIRHILAPMICAMWKLLPLVLSSWLTPSI